MKNQNTLYLVRTSREYVCGVQDLGDAARTARELHRDGEELVMVYEVLADSRQACATAISEIYSRMQAGPFGRKGIAVLIEMNKANNLSIIVHGVESITALHHTHCAKIDDLRSFGLIHDAIVSIYGADSLEADTLRVLREAGVQPVDIRAGLSMALGRLMQGL